MIYESDRLKVTSIIGAVALLMTVSAAGVLSGLGLFAIMLIKMETLGVVGSALIFSISTAVFLSCYLWISE